MKILDRYVLFSFLRDYVISFLVLIGTYIVLDMVIAFDELFEFHKADQAMSAMDVMFAIGEYYFFQTFLIFIHLSGIIPVVAAAFTLIRLSRFNELSAILAAGVPLLRVAMPIIIASVVLQVLLAVDQELIIPNIVHRLTPKHDEIYQQSEGKSFDIKAMQDDQSGLLFAARFTPATGEHPAAMREIDVIERNSQLQPIAHTRAQLAEWDAAREQWKLTNGVRVTGLLPHEKRSPPEPVDFYRSNVTPDEIILYNSGEYVNLLSRERINQLLNRRQIYGGNDLLRVKHFRVSQLVMNIVMLLVAIPCVLTRDPKALKNQIFKCLILVGLCMAGYFVAYQLAGRPPTGPQWADRWPAIVAFAPILVFAVVAIILLDRLATKET